MNDRMQARRQLEADLREAFERGEFEVFYQPLVRISTGATTAVEALVRWRHAERGMISPAEFIPVAEETGLIIPLGEWVLREACAEVASWPGGIRVSVNLSPVQFKRGDLAATVASALAAAGMDAARLDVEITETTLLQEGGKTLAILNELRRIGVRISMDDFGTGYSSLSYLRRYPFDKIKIDQSFVRELEHSSESQAIVQAVIGLGHTLGMIITAEGVETEEQLVLLRAAGCHEAQGYLFSRPKPAREMREQILERAAGPEAIEKRLLQQRPLAHHALVSRGRKN
jgi:EAL domain-containing protein (putative c-di-GMP-specific phosphodiesterase class I)